MHRVAVYGLEGHEETIFEALASRKDAILAAVASTNRSALDGYRSNKAFTPTTKIYRDWRTMLRREDVTVLAVCSQSDMHVEPILEAARRGIDVMSEKPVATDAPGLRKARRAVEKSGVAFSVLFDMRTAGPYIAMKNAVAAGAVGRPVLISAQKSYRLGERPQWMKRRSSFGGTIAYIGCHMLDLAMWITGLDVKSVAAFHGNAVSPAVRQMEDHAAVIFEMTRGAAMSLTLDYLRPPAAPTHGDARLRIAGSRGVIEVTDLESRVRLITEKNGPSDLPIPRGYNLFDDFLDSIDGKKEHAVSPADAFRVTEILLGAMRSADSARIVRV